MLVGVSPLAGQNMNQDIDDRLGPIVTMAAGTVLVLGGHPLGSGLILLALGMILNQD